MFVEFKRPNGKRASVALDKIIGFLEGDEGTGCQVLMNVPTGNGGTSENGVVAVSFGVFAIQSGESYESIRQLIQQTVINIVRQAAVTPAAQIVRPR